MSNWIATAVAASTFDRLPRPRSGVTSVAAPAGVRSSRRRAVETAVLDVRRSDIGGGIDAECHDLAEKPLGPRP